MFHESYGQALSCIGEGNGNPLQCSSLENPRDRGALWVSVYGVAQSPTWLKRLSSSSSSHLYMTTGKTIALTIQNFVGKWCLCFLIYCLGCHEAHAGIKIARRNINNFRYADDTTLKAESEEELKNLLMKVKEESEKVVLKFNIQKTKIMASNPITSWQIDGETVADFILGGSKITADGDCSHEIKRCLLLGRCLLLWPA